jgi:hypothetical protein
VRLGPDGLQDRSILGTLIVPVTHCDDAGLRVHRQVDLPLEDRTSLNDSVMQQPEGTALREDRGFLLRGTVREAKAHSSGDATAARALREIAAGDDLPVDGSHHKKPVHQTFGMPNRDWFAGCRGGEQQHR